MSSKETVPLHIHLQDGFRDDSLKLELNNEEVLREDKVTTDLRIARAKKFTISVPRGRLVVKVEILTLGLVGDYKFKVDSETYLGISVAEPETPEKKIEFLVSNEPFIYF